ncbi:MAG: hypothetical protein WBA16_03390 [Nonlabens sp.]
MNTRFLQQLAFLFICCCACKAQNRVFLDENLSEIYEEYATYYQDSVVDLDSRLTKIVISYMNDSIYKTGYKDFSKPSRRTGTWTTFYKNGNVKDIRTYSRGKSVGSQQHYFENGLLKEEFSNIKSKNNLAYPRYKTLNTADGTSLIKKGTGKLVKVSRYSWSGDIDSLLGNYKNGEPVGLWTKYRNGKLMYQETLEKGKATIGYSNYKGKKINYTGLYTDARPVDLNLFFIELRRNVQFYWEENQIKKTDYRKKISLSFIVTPFGDLQDIKVINGLGKGPDVALIKGLKRCKTKWKPGTIRGRPVVTPVTIPWRFESRFF